MNFISTRLFRLSRPRIYFAGRMTMCEECDLLDWRHQIVGYETLPNGMEKQVTPGTVVAFNGFTYCGPFLSDGTGGHAKGHGADYDGDHQRIFNTDKVQIERCDLFLCYLDDMLGFGSLVEIGMAHGLGKPIVLGLGPHLTESQMGELWFAQMAASQVYFGTPTRFWEQVKDDWLMGGRS